MYVIDNLRTEAIFERFMALSQDAFAIGLYESAYHALDAAFHCAHSLQSTQRLLSVQTLATEQSEWIDLHAPESIMSSQEAENRGGVSFYKTVMRKASSQATFIQAREHLRKPSAGAS